MKYSESQALARAAAYCSKAERAESDVYRKLQGWELEVEAIVRILERLKKENFLNEERFCRSFIKDKIRFNKWGKVKIVYELKKKKVSNSIIDKCFEELEDEEFDEPLLRLLANKVKTVKAANDYEKQAKLIRFGLGRGYSIEQIKRTLQKLNCGDEDYSESFL